MDPAGQPEGGYPAGQIGAGRPVASDHQADIGPIGGQARERLDEEVEPLLGHHPSKAEHEPVEWKRDLLGGSIPVRLDTVGHDESSVRTQPETTSGVVEDEPGARTHRVGSPEGEAKPHPQGGRPLVDVVIVHHCLPLEADDERELLVPGQRDRIHPVHTEALDVQHVWLELDRRPGQLAERYRSGRWETEEVPGVRPWHRQDEAPHPQATDHLVGGQAGRVPDRPDLDSVPGGHESPGKSPSEFFDAADGRREGTGEQRDPHVQCSIRTRSYQRRIDGHRWSSTVPGAAWESVCRVRSSHRDSSAEARATASPGCSTRIPLMPGLIASEAPGTFVVTTGTPLPSASRMARLKASYCVGRTRRSQAAWNSATSSLGPRTSTRPSRPNAAACTRAWLASTRPTTRSRRSLRSRRRIADRTVVKPFLSSSLATKSMTISSLFSPRRLRISSRRSSRRSGLNSSGEKPLGMITISFAGTRYRRCRSSRTRGVVTISFL